MDVNNILPWYLPDIGANEKHNHVACFCDRFLIEIRSAQKFSFEISP